MESWVGFGLVFYTVLVSRIEPETRRETGYSLVHPQGVGLVGTEVPGIPNLSQVFAIPSPLKPKMGGRVWYGLYWVKLLRQSNKKAR